jgi:hypothetical protein
MALTVYSTEQHGSVPCRVIGYLGNGWWRVLLGVGVGHLDGGLERDWRGDEIPAWARRPNAVFHAADHESLGRIARGFRPQTK